ncbi:MAG: MTH865 family protein [Natrialbaceae archaeon]|nr:MTH865 family protein [Natrialbaceae archaeon]
MTAPDPIEVRDQLIEAFEGADYPVQTPMDVLPALPEGPATTFESGDWSMTVMDLQTIDIDEETLEEFGIDGEEAQDMDLNDRFPYDSAEAIADELLVALQVSGELPTN